MYQDFHVVDRWTKNKVHCIYQALIVAIATRHADAVDIKFLVDGRTVWVALPHPAWVEYKKRTGQVITDQLAVEIAGHYLKTALESGEGVGREMYSLTVEETLKHLEAVVGRSRRAQPVARCPLELRRDDVLLSAARKVLSAAHIAASTPLAEDICAYVGRSRLQFTAGRSAVLSRKSFPAASGRAAG